MPQVYATAESVQELAQTLIGQYHDHLATARIKYVFKEKSGKKGGRVVPGKPRKISGVLEFLLEADFLIEVGLDWWNDASSEARTALVDHLLECCHGEEDEKTGAMKWSLRDPDVHEFPTILRRRGSWNKELEELVEVSKEVVG